MDDQQLWHQAVRIADETYTALPGDIRKQLDTLIRRIMRLKEELLELSLAAGSADICRACNGKCCLHGKYHVTLLDLLAYRNCESEMLMPVFGNAPFCPYGGTNGCFMPPRFRPMTCVIFNCELVEERMATADCQQAAACERELRDTIARAEQLAGSRLNRAALLCCGG